MNKSIPEQIHDVSLEVARLALLARTDTARVDLHRMTDSLEWLAQIETALGETPEVQSP